MKRLKRLPLTVMAYLALLFMPEAYARWGDVNMPQGVTAISQSIYHLHMTILWICLLIGVLVFGVMIYALVRHRKSKGAVAAQFHANTTLEIVWATIPFLILIAMAIPATRVLIQMEDSSAADVTIRITGYQWKWKYDYLDEGFGFFSNLSTPLEQIQQKAPKGQHYLLEVDREMVVPVQKKIRLLTTSNDVIHSWWVPELGIKRDALPGFINEAWMNIEKAGVYRGQCAELCGVNHAYMPIVVRAVSEQAYQDWVRHEKKAIPSNSKPSPQQLPYETAMKLGQSVFERHCAACHGLDGRGHPPYYPALKASSVIHDKAVSRQIKLILNGVKGTAMQSFANQLTDAELASVITYTRNAWENQTGDLIQAQDIAQER